MLKALPLLLLPFLIVSGQDFKDEVRLKFQYYDDNNGVTVYQPMMAVTKSIRGKSRIKAHVLVDALTAASRRVFYPVTVTDTLDGVTAASQSEVRQEYNAGISHQFKNTQAGLSGSHSRENDYTSYSGGFNLKQDLFTRNTNLAVNYTRFEDEVKPLIPTKSSLQLNNSDYTLTETGLGTGGKKSVNSLTLGWTQTFTNRTVGMLSWGLIHSNGYHSRAYYHVLVEQPPPAVTADPGENTLPGGTFYLESAPDNKVAHAGVARLKQHFTSFYRTGSFELLYRRTIDNWGMDSHTLSTDIQHYLAANLILKARYRYYRQSQVEFYRDRYTWENVTPGNPNYLAYRTVDSRLAALESHLFQAKLIFILKNFFKPETGGLFALFPTRLDAEVEKYLRSTHSHQEIRQRRYEYYDSGGLTAWLIRCGIIFAY